MRIWMYFWDSKTTIRLLKLMMFCLFSCLWGTDICVIWIISPQCLMSYIFVILILNVCCMFLFKDFDIHSLFFHRSSWPILTLVKVRKFSLKRKNVTQIVDNFPPFCDRYMTQLLSAIKYNKQLLHICLLYIIISTGFVIFPQSKYFFLYINDWYYSFEY